MKKYMFSALFAAALMVSSGYAQSNDARATVPFSFRVGDAVMPAGTYTIRDAPGMFTIREVNGKPGAFSLSINSATRAKATETPTLTFKRYGEEYYLTSVWPAASRDGRTIPVGKRAKALAQEHQRVETAEIPIERASR